jgi:hypothetical protein
VDIGPGCSRLDYFFSADQLLFRSALKLYVFRLGCTAILACLDPTRIAAVAVWTSPLQLDITKGSLSGHGFSSGAMIVECGKKSIVRQAI